jgi:beta-glucosidase/6-phospho-beta-glucosidase/beta-galactosidase
VQRVAREVGRVAALGAQAAQGCRDVVGADGRSRWAGEVFGYDTVTRDYHARYRLPVMHTETNIDEGPRGDEAERWLWKQWSGIMRLRQEGVPMLGFTWYSLNDQIDWHTALREQRGDVHPRGLYDLDRNIRTVGRAYKRLIEAWKPVLQAENNCLTLPVMA